MAKRLFAAGLGGRVKVFHTKRGCLKWMISTRDGWKYLFQVPFRLWIVHPIFHVIVAVQEFMHKPEKP